MKRTYIMVLVLIAASVIISANTEAESNGGPIFQKDQLVKVDRDLAVKRLGEALRFKTVSHEDPGKFYFKPFLEMQEWMKSAYPQAHSKLRLDVIDRYALLYTWKGKNPSLKPLMLIAHMDVVPVEQGSEGKWTHDPWGGESAGGFVWGRGALDDKFCVTGLLETVEALINEGYVPERTVCLGFGYDEEVAGKGAGAIAAYLKANGVTPEYVLDEGGCVKSQGLPDVGVRNPIAAISVAEKGYLTLEVVVETKGGHSAQPGEHTAAGILARVITELEKNQFPRTLKVTNLTFKPVSHEMPFMYRMILGNTWLTAPLVKSILKPDPMMDSLMHTTTAVTMLSSGVKENVLPQKAVATVNFRILQGDSVAGVTEHVSRIVDKVKKGFSVPELKISVKPLPGPIEPTTVSSLDSAGYGAVVTTIRQVLEDDRKIVVGPYVNNGSSDSRMYKIVTPDVYGFYPISLTDELIDTMHGNNERIPVDGYILAIQYWAQLIKNTH